MEGLDLAQNIKDFLAAQNTGQAALPFGVQIIEGVPFALEHIGEKEFDTALGDAQSGSRPLVLIAPMQEIVLQLFFGNLVGRAVVKINQLAHGAGVALLSAFAHSGKLQGLNRFLVIVFHGIASLGFNHLPLANGVKRGYHKNGNLDHLVGFLTGVWKLAGAE